jgi:hypothetical protein
MESGKESPGLQAADLFAYQSYQHAKIRIANGRPMRLRELPTLLRKLLTNMRDDHDFPFFDANGIREALQNFPPALRTKNPVTASSA